MTELLLFDIEPNRVPVMPDTIKGRTKMSCGYTLSQPREWTAEEVQWITKLRDEGWDSEAIAESVGRTEVSVSIKLKRLGKKNNTYNAEHLQEKYIKNAEYANVIHPASVLDLYCGVTSWWRKQGYNAVTNDVNTEIEADYHERAEMLIHKLFYDGNTFDLIDLDPFGSAYDCFDLAIKMAKRGIIITYGEMGHKRFKRLDYVRRYYGIETMDDFTIERLIAETQKIALRNKKKLTPVIIGNWNRISRVYYTIESVKITEQWD